MKRNCTFAKNFNRYLVNMKEQFFAHGYLEQMIKEQTKRVVFEKKQIKHRKILLKEYFLLLHSILCVYFQLRRLKSSTPTPMVAFLEKSKITWQELNVIRQSGMQVLENETKVAAKCVIILKEQTSFLIQLHS